MPSKINCFVDTVSPYSFYTFVYLQKNDAILKDHGVDLEYHPVFLGGINHMTGNQPPIMLPARAKHFPYEQKRAARYFGVEVKPPENFPFLSLQPQRCLTFIKQNYPNDRFVAALESFFRAAWQDGQDISNPATVATILADSFSGPEVDKIVAGAATDGAKKKLVETTTRAVDSGAYGAPWFLVRNSAGEQEPFFGSDRFHYIWHFLGLPHRNLELERPAPKL